MKFLDKPFIPNKEVSLILVDKRIPKNIEDVLKNKKIEILKTCKCSEVYDAIKYHPDIVLCYLGEKNIVVAPNVYEYYEDMLNPFGFNVIKGNEFLKSKYPQNISYNVAIFGKYAVHNFKYTEENILNYINEKKLKKIDVKQGYSKCSICIVDENSIITSDEGIHKEVIKHNIDSLLIKKGHIDLFGMNYGFIGGCTGLISENELAFLGDVKKHVNYLKIKDFLDKKGKKIVILGENKLIDLGSIIPIMTRKE
ncbi:DUF6873 family GME fold protein [Tepidibacter formicigenes]|jgi:hypothetical protein|uniref:DUF6873 domain-containing protein n=1 Tax=Tepidibacter formicigenes DSM 15518 TaxID=1123349 RepID=A0A1M6KNI6_9FIRM|nr:hypothetical protein [Tepidibacter formicigenes]SHJ60472.1 hypothetical protein SAMN02744037_00411 [Tepidibacter formicigenes DSM 15518]